MSAPLIATPVQEVYTPVPQRTQAQIPFDNNADMFLASLPGVATSINAVAFEFNSLAAYIDAIAITIDADRVATELAAAAALASQNAAAVSAAAALSSQNAAAISRTAAEAAALSAGTSATNSLANANSAALSASNAATSLAGTLNAAGLSGAKAFATYALALAGIGTLTTNQPVFVVTDETRGNMGAYYTYNGTALVFSRLHEYYASPVSYVASDSVQNMITKLLVLSGAIPQTPPSIDADFNNPAYLP